MIKGISILVFIILGIGQGVGQVVWMDTTFHDFGKVSLETTKEYTFQFKNIGPQPITIDNVRTNCGCTSPGWSESPVFPGEQGEIRIQFKPQRRGTTKKRIKVYFHEVRKPEVLWIRAFVH